MARAGAPPANKVLAMSYNNLAWLTALKDGQGKDALANVNRAIELAGPRPTFSTLEASSTWA